MSSCRKWREHLVESVYGELEGERRSVFELHLASCASCSSELERLSATAVHIAEALPARPVAGELDVWRRLVPQLDALDRPAADRPRPFFGPRLTLGYPAATALAALILAVGLGLGLFLRPQPAQQVVAEIDASEVAFARYLQRATPLLLAVANRQMGQAASVSLDSTSFDTGAERRLAERLASEATGLSLELEDQDHRREAALLSDLAVVFLQIANLPAGEYHHGIEMVQATIESRALLFQLSVEEMRRL